MFKVLNRFFVKYKGKPLRLAPTDGSNLGLYFDTIAEARKTANIYAKLREVKPELFTIHTATKPGRAEVSDYSEEVSNYFKAHKTFSGDGLRYNTVSFNPESSYKPGFYYGKEVQMYRSTNSRVTELPKFSSKKEYFIGTETFTKLCAIRERVIPTHLDSKLKAMNLGKKALIKRLRMAGYSISETKQALQGYTSK